MILSYEKPVISLWDMIKTDVAALVRIVSSLAATETMLKRFDPDGTFDEEAARQVAAKFQEIRDDLDGFGPLTEMELDRVIGKLNAGNCSYGELRRLEQSINQRLEDEASLIMMFKIDTDFSKYWDGASSEISQEVFDRYPSVIFDADEACKCIALDRPTACAFHLMRIVEIGLKASAKHLGIPNPVKESDRNWAAMIRKLNGELEAQKASLDADKKQMFRDLIVSVDAIKNAWRNATMHCETKYTREEAQEILICVRGFMRKIASRFDEAGAAI